MSIGDANYSEFKARLDATAIRVAEKLYGGLRDGFQDANIAWGKKRAKSARGMTLGSVYSCLEILTKKG